MKCELIEYHRKEIEKWMDHFANQTPVVEEQIAWHERAAAWLESLIEDEEAMKVAAQIRKPPQQCETQKV